MKKLVLYLMLIASAAGMAVVQSCKKEKDPTPVKLSVKSYYPNSGNGGTLVTILGAGFNNDEKLSVSFAGTDAEILNRQDTILVVRAPLKGGSGNIKVTAGSQLAEAGNYNYQSLTVKQFFPLNGPAGMHVRISGEGFSSVNGPAEVHINGKAATVVSASDTLIVAEIPVAAGSGPVTVKVDGKSSSGAAFRFQSITGIKPMTGGAGTKVVIRGSGFEGVAAGNLVDFNGKPAVVAEAAEDHLVVTAPAGLSTGPVSVVVNAQKTTGPDFTVVPFPQIAMVTPLSGPAGAEMTITGLHFSTEKDENIVKINGKAVAVATAAPNKLTLILPGGTGNGKVSLTVNDQGITGPDFKDQVLGITNMQPTNGLAGTKVTITGTGFSAVAGENIVTFNGLAAPVESATENTITVIAPVGLSTGVLKVKRAALEAQAPEAFRRAGIMTLAGGPQVNTLLTNSMTSFAMDSKGNIFITDRGRYNVLKVTKDGNVSVFAGSESGEMGMVNGKGTAARFAALRGIAIDAQDNIFVSDVGNTNSIRKITPDGTVTTFRSGLQYQPGRIILDKQGNLHITQLWYGMLKIYPNGATEKTYAGSVSDDCTPAFDNAGNMYFYPDENEFFLSKWSHDNISTFRWLGGPMGYVDGPFQNVQFMFGIRGLLLDTDGNLLIFDKSNAAIRKADFTSKEVRTLAKMAMGYEDGSFEKAKISFSSNDMIMDKEGNIYILDAGNKAIRKVFLK